MNKTRILSVYDEANIVDGQRRMPRRQQDELDMAFVTSAAVALPPAVNNAGPKARTDSVSAPTINIAYLGRIGLEKRVEVWAQALKASLLQPEVPAT